jgi:CHAD domain-containing protein
MPGILASTGAEQHHPLRVKTHPPASVDGRHRDGNDRRIVLEREIKLAVTPAFRLPALGDRVEAVPLPPRRLSATYFDTDDLRLARWGASLRRRTDQGWTVKLPGEADGQLLAREELTFPGPAGRPPGAAVNLVRAYIRTAPLRPQARLRTMRRRTELRDPQGRVLAELVDDEVSVLDGHRIAMRFRELEVEATEGTPPRLLGEIAAWLHEAGAAASEATSKVARALGPRATGPPDVVVPPLPAAAAGGDVVRRAVAASVLRLIRHDPGMRLDRDPEDVHQSRVATRRLRSDLRTFRGLVQAEWASSLRDELGWLAGILGAVRDRDVMLHRMARRADGLAEASRPRAAGILAALQAARGEAHAELLETLRGHRYLDLLDGLVEAANAPLLLPEAELPAKDVLPGLVRQPLRALTRQVKALGDGGSEDELHQIRIRAKRARYAAEAVAPVLGKRARAVARAAASLQETLGEHQDAVVAERWLRAWVQGSRSVPAAFTAGELAGLERAAAADARARWPEAWQAFSMRRGGWP